MKTKSTGFKVTQGPEVPNMLTMDVVRGQDYYGMVRIATVSKELDSMDILSVQINYHGVSMSMPVVFTDMFELMVLIYHYDVSVRCQYSPVKLSADDFAVIQNISNKEWISKVVAQNDKSVKPIPVTCEDDPIVEHGVGVVGGSCKETINAIVMDEIQHTTHVKSTRISVQRMDKGGDAEDDWS